MATYFQGYQNALDHVSVATEQELLEQIDALYGRSYLPKDFTLDQLRAEAMRQTRLDWLDQANENYQSSRKNLMEMVGG